MFNYGKHKRDFTYVDDIVEGIFKILNKPAEPNKEWESSRPDPGTSFAPWRVYNIGNSKPVELMEYINAVEKALNKKAILNMLPLQPGDVIETYADVEDLIQNFGYKPSTSIEEGVENFINWYINYYKK